MLEKQIDKSHYEFHNYISQDRWISLWYQLSEVMSLKPRSVLEVGPGPGLLKTFAKNCGVSVETVDIDPELRPDCVASATSLPFSENAYGCVCAFQMLEHLPYRESVKALAEMVRVADDYVLISLPDAKVLWAYSLYFPKIGQVAFHFPRPRLFDPPKEFDGQHYWEINAKGYPLQKVIADLVSLNVMLIRTYRLREIGSEKFRFFLFKKVHNGTDGLESRFRKVQA